MPTNQNNHCESIRHIANQEIGRALANDRSRYLTSLNLTAGGIVVTVLNYEETASVTLAIEKCFIHWPY